MFPFKQGCVKAKDKKCFDWNNQKHVFQHLLAVNNTPFSMASFDEKNNKEFCWKCILDTMNVKDQREQIKVFRQKTTLLKPRKEDSAKALLDFVKGTIIGDFDEDLCWFQPKQILDDLEIKLKCTDHDTQLNHGLHKVLRSKRKKTKWFFQATIETVTEAYINGLVCEDSEIINALVAFRRTSLLSTKQLSNMSNSYKYSKVLNDAEKSLMLECITFLTNEIQKKETKRASSPQFMFSEEDEDEDEEEKMDSQDEDDDIIIQHTPKKAKISRPLKKASEPVLTSPTSVRESINTKLHDKYNENNHDDNSSTTTTTTTTTCSSVPAAETNQAASRSVPKHGKLSVFEKMKNMKSVLSKSSTSTTSAEKMVITCHVSGPVKIKNSYHAGIFFAVNVKNWMHQSSKKHPFWCVKAKAIVDMMHLLHELDEHEFQNFDALVTNMTVYGLRASPNHQENLQFTTANGFGSSIPGTVFKVDDGSYQDMYNQVCSVCMEFNRILTASNFKEMYLAALQYGSNDGLRFRPDGSPVFTRLAAALTQSAGQPFFRMMEKATHKIKKGPLVNVVLDGAIRTIAEELYGTKEDIERYVSNDSEVMAFFFSIGKPPRSFYWY